MHEMTDRRGVGVVRMRWDGALHDKVGVTQCEAQSMLANHMQRILGCQSLPMVTQ